jgi:DNA-binding transcriptional LysR family regulator
MTISSPRNVPQRLGRLRLRHLQLLEMLESTEPLRRIAERMHCTQPAISQMVKEIELAFGGPLFSRTRKGLVPNSRMHTLMRRVRVMLGEIEIARSEMEAGGSHRPVVRIGANLHLLTHILPAAITALRTEHPALRFSLQEGDVDSLFRLMSAGELDCAVCRISATASRVAAMGDFAFFPMHEATLCIIIGRKHPLFRRKKIRLHDLVDEDWALSAPSGKSRQLLSDAFIRAGLPVPDPIVECRPLAANLAIATELPLVTVGMRAEALPGQQAGLLRILPIRLEQEATLVSFVCRKALVGMHPLPQVRAAVAESCRKAGLPAVRSPR